MPRRHIFLSSILYAFALGAALLGCAHADEPKQSWRAKQQDVVDPEQAIRLTLAKLSKAATDKDADAVLGLLAPTLRDEIQGSRINIPGDNHPVTIVRSPWGSELGRVRMTRLGSTSKVLMLKRHEIDSAVLWEAFLYFDNEQLQYGDLWYFVENGDGLLIIDWPFGGDPERSVKRFELNRGHAGEVPRE